MTKEKSGSPKLKLNKEDGKKILKGAGIAAGAAVVGYVATLLPFIDFGPNTPIIVAVAGILINATLKWFKGNS